MSSSIDYIKPGNIVFCRPSLRACDYQLAHVVAIFGGQDGQEMVQVKWLSTETTSVLPLDDQLYQTIESKRVRKAAKIVNIDESPTSPRRRTAAVIDSSRTTTKKRKNSPSSVPLKKTHRKSHERKSSTSRKTARASTSSEAAVKIVDDDDIRVESPLDTEPVYWTAKLPTDEKPNSTLHSSNVSSQHHLRDKKAAAAAIHAPPSLPLPREQQEENVQIPVDGGGLQSLPAQEEHKMTELRPLLQAPMLTSMGLLVASKLKIVDRIPHVSLALSNRTDRTNHAGKEGNLPANLPENPPPPPPVKYFEEIDQLQLRQFLARVKKQKEQSSKASAPSRKGTHGKQHRTKQAKEEEKKKGKKKKKKKLSTLDRPPPLTAMGCLTACLITDLSLIPKISTLAEKKPMALHEKRFSAAYSDWSGNSDDEGSVDYPLLDEEICNGCGADVPEDEWSNMILCDECNDSFHLACANLEALPDGSEPFYCPRCTADKEFFASMDYTVDEQFEEGMKLAAPDATKPAAQRALAVRTGSAKEDSTDGSETDGKPNYCFSPSRPIEIAWKEFERKGFMLVSQVFNYEIMKRLTHGLFEKKTFVGRVTDSWHGAIAEMRKRIGSGSHSLVDRAGRFDMRIPDFVAAELKLADTLQPILSRLRTVMSATSTPELRTHNIVYVPVGSKDQEWHVDDVLIGRGRPQRYFTILIHLNRVDDLCGGTEIWSKELDRGDLIRGRPGDAFVFAGSMLHRGLGNGGFGNRLFYYASFSTVADANTESG